MQVKRQTPSTVHEEDIGEIDLTNGEEEYNPVPPSLVPSSKEEFDRKYPPLNITGCNTEMKSPNHKSPESNHTDGTREQAHQGQLYIQTLDGKYLALPLNFDVAQSDGLKLIPCPAQDKKKSRSCTMEKSQLSAGLNKHLVKQIPVPAGLNNCPVKLQPVSKSTGSNFRFTQHPVTTTVATGLQQQVGNTSVIHQTFNTPPVYSTAGLNNVVRTQHINANPPPECNADNSEILSVPNLPNETSNLQQPKAPPEKTNYETPAILQNMLFMYENGLVRDEIEENSLNASEPRSASITDVNLKKTDVLKSITKTQETIGPQQTGNFEILMQQFFNAIRIHDSKINNLETIVPPSTTTSVNLVSEASKPCSETHEKTDIQQLEHLKTTMQNFGHEQQTKCTTVQQKKLDAAKDTQMPQLGGLEAGFQQPKQTNHNSATPSEVRSAIIKRIKNTPIDLSLKTTKPSLMEKILANSQDEETTVTISNVPTTPEKKSRKRYCNSNLSSLPPRKRFHPDHKSLTSNSQIASQSSYHYYHYYDVFFHFIFVFVCCMQFIIFVFLYFS